MAWLQTLIVTGFTGLLILGSGCQKESVEIDQSFVNLYVDLRLATLGNANDTQRAWKTRQIIFQKYGTDVKTFSEKVKEIQTHQEVWEEFHNLVLTRIDSVEKIHKGE